MAWASAQVVDSVSLDGRPLAFGSLTTTPVSEGRHVVELVVNPTRESRLVLPPCAGKAPPQVSVDGRATPTTASARGQYLTVPAGTRHVALTLAVSAYEKRVACGFAPRFGVPAQSDAGLRLLSFSSARPKGTCARCRPGQALVYVPRSVADEKARGFPNGKPPLLVGLHPWNGALETYAAYSDLLDAAEARGVVLLFPDGLGNSLYTADAEDEVLAALDALQAVLPLDAERISLFGASMGGAGATTIGFHHPDRFAFATSLFGDSKYDLSTYVRRLIPNEAAARKVNALDVVDNARNLPLLLVHGDADKSSSITQSILLDEALRKRGFAVSFHKKAGRGHEGALVSEYAKEIVERAVIQRRLRPTRVTYRSWRARDVGAYGLTFTKTKPDGEAFVDVERVADSIVVHRAEGISSLMLAPHAFDAPSALPIVRAAGAAKVAIAWAPR